MKFGKKCPIIFLSFLLFFSCFFPVCSAFEPPENTPKQVDWSRIFFLGESTTAHLKRRGALLGEYAATNVFAPDSGTLMLSSRTLLQNVRIGQTNEKMPLLNAIEQIKPPVLLLSFGLNGIVGFHSDEERYLRCYSTLIRSIQAASPGTQIVLQTIYPVAEKQAEWRFKSAPEEINSWIRSLNARLAELAESEKVPLWDTASLLSDESGFLRAEFSSDGIHLTEAGYTVILQYIAERAEEFEG